MGALGSFLSSFSESFTAAVIMWPFLSFLLTMPILAFLYHRDGRLRFASAAAAYCSVLYLAGLACFTLYPLPTGDAGPGITYGIPPQFNPLNFIFDIVKDGRKAVFQTLFNVVLFLPLGFIAGRFLQMKLPAADHLGACRELLDRDRTTHRAFWHLPLCLPHLRSGRYHLQHLRWRVGVVLRKALRASTATSTGRFARDHA